MSERIVSSAKNPFPVTDRWIYLNHCGVSPLPGPAYDGASRFLVAQSQHGIGLFQDFSDISNRFRKSFSSLIRCSPENVSFVKNTAEALGMIAGGYPFSKGDEIVSYIHEYPSNHYPWKIQERRGARLVLLKNTGEDHPVPDDLPVAWSMEELEKTVSKKTKILALSHVQFTSGFAADLKKLSAFCRERKIDLIIDAAQSLGSLPVYPQEWGIAAVAASGWKWMLGPMGTGFLYTEPALREKLEWILGGPGLMKQGDDYLDHTWDPQTDGRAFEYSTPPLALMEAQNRNLEEFFTKIPPEAIRDRIFELQDRFLERIDREHFRPLLFDGVHRSGIISFFSVKDPVELSRKATGKGLMISSRGGYLRIAPHFYNTDEDLDRAAEILNELILSEG